MSRQTHGHRQPWEALETWGAQGCCLWGAARLPTDPSTPEALHQEAKEKFLPPPRPSPHHDLPESLQVCPSCP